ncbi:MAG: hypothetical protein ACKVPX_07240 [Myxococcaceae bacterium]
MLLAGAGWLYRPGSDCGQQNPTETKPNIELNDNAHGLLRAGWGRADVTLPWPVPVAGYPGFHRQVTRAEIPLEAQAVGVEVGALAIAVVSFDLLTVTEAISDALRANGAALGFDDVWVVATHSHSSVGGYDERWLAAWAGTGRPRDAIEQALIGAGKEALNEAWGARCDAAFEWSTGQSEGLVQSRSGEASVDTRIDRLRFVCEGGGAAQFLILAAHPTLVPRDAKVAHPDFPGLLSQMERPSHEVTLVLQGAGGNAAAVVPDGTAPAPVRYAAALSKTLRGLVPRLREPAGAGVHFRLVRATLRLPALDASRWVPQFLERSIERVLCGSAPKALSLRHWTLGPLALVAVPLEPTHEVAQRLESAAGATRVIGLANGYAGYVEEETRVRRHAGESKRQYFVPNFAGQLGQALQALAPAQR